MNNIWTIARREFVTRAFKKKFILITILTPLLLALFIGIATMIMSYEDTSQVRVALVDPNGLVPDSLLTYKNLHFTKVGSDWEKYRDSIGETIDGIILFPEFDPEVKEKYHPQYLSGDKVNMATRSDLESYANEVVRTRYYKLSGLDAAEIERLRSPAELDTRSVSSGERSGGEMAAALGAIAGFLLYMLLTINGSMIMRSVMEEKINRIVEVMINTVRPFDLMMGKILGVGFVGIFQVLIWMIITPLLTALAIQLFGGSPEVMASPGANVPPEMAESLSGEIWSQLSSINWALFIPMFILYFILGYLMYASLFAAIGSTMGDDLGEGQSLVMVVIMPLIIGMYISFSVIRAPDSPLAFWGSMIPFFSPIVMPTRLAFSPPLWQIIVSLVVLIGSAVLFAWISGRIYRVGILMYGKKASLKEMMKWFSQK